MVWYAEGVFRQKMKYFKRLGVAIMIDVAALLFAAAFFVLGRFLSIGQNFRVPIFAALLVSGFLGIGRYLSSHKTSILFDHASLLIGMIKLGLAIMALIPVPPTDSVFFIMFSFLMVASGISHFENMVVIQRVKGVLWQPTVYLSVLVTGIGIVMLIAGPPEEGRARLVYACCLVVEALASLLEIVLLRNKLSELHEAALTIAEDVKEAIKKDAPPPNDSKTVINVLPLQNVQTLTPEEVKQMQTDGTLPGAASSLAVSARPADRILYQEGEKKDEPDSEKTEEKKKKKIPFPDDLV